MKQSNNKKSRDVTAFLYERLSRDDNLEGESYSIGNQKKLLAKLRSEIEKQSSRSMTTDMFIGLVRKYTSCLLYTSPSPRDPKTSRMPSAA